MVTKYQPHSVQDNGKLGDANCRTILHLQRFDNPRQAVILTDSKTSLHLIKQRIPKRYSHGITRIHENIITLKNLGWDIHLQWIPSHCNIRGNELVDHQANLGRGLQDITYPIELNNLKKLNQKA